MLERRLIENCAPTLAGMKSANLFNYYFSFRHNVYRELKEVNHKLNSKGVYVETLLWKEDSVLIYVYRKSHLERELQQPEVKEFLSRYGYIDCGINSGINGSVIESLLQHLRERLYKYQCFPHEIGIFLGYPLPDVIGFIENKGRDCKYCGLWKVYCNECETLKLFERLKKCTQVYLQVFAEGRSIVQMTVSA